MYRFSFLIIVFIITVYSCEKTETEKKIPATFTKRVIMEEFTGEWCSSCVNGAKFFNEILDDNPEKVFGVAHHYDDPLEIKDNNLTRFLLSFYHIRALPDAIIDRVYREDHTWNVQVKKHLEEKAIAGLKIQSNFKDYNLNIDITLASHEDLGTVLLTVMLVEDNVKESSPGAQNKGGGNYIHRHVLRKVLSYYKGDPVTLKKDETLHKSYSVKTKQYKKEDLNIVAILHYGKDKKYAAINTNGVKGGKTGTW